MAESTVSAYEVPPPSRCMACDAIESTRKTYENNPQVPRPGALRFGAVRRVIADTKRRLPGTRHRQAS